MGFIISGLMLFGVFITAILIIYYTITEENKRKEEEKKLIAYKKRSKKKPLTEEQIKAKREKRKAFQEKQEKRREERRQRTEKWNKEREEKRQQSIKQWLESSDVDKAIDVQSILNEYGSIAGSQYINNIDNDKPIKQEMIEIWNSLFVEEKRPRNPTQATKHIVYARDNGRCVICKSTQDLEYDHIWPYSKGGDREPNNIQLLCRKCNRSKSAKV